MPNKISICDKIRTAERRIAEKTIAKINMEARYQLEKYRKKHCPIPSDKCPISPIRPNK